MSTDPEKALPEGKERYIHHRDVLSPVIRGSVGTIQGYTGLRLGGIWGIRRWITQGLNRSSGYFAVNNKEPDAQEHGT